MILDGLYALNISAVEAMVVSHATGFTTDAFDLQAANINNGGGPVFVNIVCTALDASPDANKYVTIKLQSSSASAFTAALTSDFGTVTRNTNATGFPILATGQVLKMQLPENCGRYIRAIATSDGLGATPKTATYKIFLSTT
jgi:hypothetical protein